MSSATGVSLPLGSANPVRLRRDRSRSPWLQVLSTLGRDRLGSTGAAILLTLIVVAVFAPLIAPYPPAEQHIGQEHAPPGGAFPLGADDLGRDVLSRVMHGARISLMVGALATALGAAVGVSTGVVAGYVGGVVDALIVRSYDVLLAFPGIILGIAVISVLGASATNVAYALAIGNAPLFARLARASVLSERERDYVHAARSIGSTRGRIMFRHVLPNILAPLLVQTSLAIGVAVLAEAGLSFLGLGTQPPDPSWGSMLNESRAYLREAPWFGFWPGVALTTLLVGLNFFSDALRDALDPRRIAV
jgi:peptide/nickel transport system permease protein